MRVAAIVFGLTALVFAQKDSLESPSEMRQGMESQRPVMRPSPAQVEQAAGYLALWDKAGREAKGRERLDLGQLRSWAGEVERALDTMRAVAADSTLDAALRTDARSQYAVAVSLHLRKLSTAGIAAARKTLTAMAEEGKDDDDGKRATLWHSITRLARLEGDWDATRKAAWKAIRAKPRTGSLLASYVIGAQLSGVYRMKEYDALRERIKETVAEITESAAQSSSGRRSNVWAQFVADKISRETKFLDLLGKLAPAWTVEHAFQGPSTLAEQKGKVVLVYFWLTASDEAVRGLATLRDLAMRYKDEPFSIVGVTWRTKRVYPARYELDVDIDEPKGDGAKPTTPARSESDEDKLKRSREGGRDTIAAFLKNHRITWPVVMIPKGEVASWCGQGQLPTTLLIDAQGRVRHITPGSLRRTSKISKEEIPKVIDALLSEPR